MQLRRRNLKEKRDKAVCLHRVCVRDCQAGGQDVRRPPCLLLTGAQEKVPQIGWNRVECNGSPLFEGIATGTPFYFVNSFAAAQADDEIATARYGSSFTAAIARGNLFGVQFHPEKSSLAGLRLLRNFAWM